MPVERKGNERNGGKEEENAGMRFVVIVVKGRKSICQEQSTLRSTSRYSERQGRETKVGPVR
jgi:hypothetical protein